MPQPRSTTRSGSSAVGVRSRPWRRLGEAASSRRRNSSTWRYFAWRVGLTRPCASLIPSARDRVVLGEQPVLGAGRGAGAPRPRRCAARGAAAARPSWSPAAGGSRSAVSTCQLPNGSASSASTAASAAAPDGVVGGVRLRVVVRRHLQVAPGLEVDDPELDTSHLAALDHRRRLTLAPAAGQRAHQLVGVEDGRTDRASPCLRRSLTGPRRGRR